MGGNSNIQRIYFSGLDALRFFAAFSVFIGHVELTKQYLKLPNCAKLFEYLNFGGMGVYFFFVLSGFLITYLLLEEKNQVGNVYVSKFYLRRILRIWPLYFLMIIVGFFVLPNFEFYNLFHSSFLHNYPNTLCMYILMIPNLAFSIYPPVPHIGQLWSIGVEEQFYLFWPLIVKFSNKIIKTITILIVLYLSLKVFILVLPSDYLGNERYRIVKLFFGMTKFECMLIGSLGGSVLYFKNKFFMELLLNKVLLNGAVLMFPFLGFLSSFPSSIQDAIHIPLSILFLIIIINVAFNQHAFFILKNSILNYLGRISYGFYMYHFFVVFTIVKLFSTMLVKSPVIGNVLIYSLSFVLSILISSISYRYFEVFFIKMKSGFSKILTEKG